MKQAPFLLTESGAFRADWEALLDRLVDGELSDDERRQALQDLEARPEGWRACALAFLEAQTWKRDLSALAQQASPAPAERSLAPTKRHARRDVWLERFALVASVAIAFFVVDRWRQGPALPNSNSGIAASQEGIRENGGDPTADQLAGSPNASGQAESTNDPQVMAPELDDEGQYMVNLPVLPASNSTADQLLQRRPLPENVRRELLRAGHQVRESRELLPVLLESGERALIPVDEYTVQYVGNKAFQ